MTATEEPTVGSFINTLPAGEWVHAHGLMWRKEPNDAAEDEG